MKSMKRLFIALFAAALLQTSLFAKADPVSVSKIEFKRLQPSDILASPGQWTRIMVEVAGNENPDDKSNNEQWVRDVEVALTLVYLDEKAKKSERNKPENMIVLKNKAKLFAVKCNQKVPVVFYIPPEAFPIYRLSKDPFAYSIELSVGGTPVALSRENMRTLLSKNIARSTDVKKVYDSYQKLVQSASAANENVLMTLRDVPLNVQRYEYNKTSGAIPTYLPTK